ncbi:response regulator transcription factor [Hymenobacter baengnokdamensis]|uniref:response regulator transcription factor n=1 Tax=Hymenobacter baengnokdamensis TaxID=2615203 RepID=UPI001E5AFB37|nr:response regulator transcription factor [Hymenobacter baengnokdamensis]
MKILYVEDEPFLAQIVSDGLTKNGYEVLHLRDGAAAAAAFEHFSPALAVVDIMLPTLDGYALVEKIRRSGSKIPIIFLSAKDSVADVVSGFHRGGNDYLRKPFSLDELFVRIDSLLARFGIREAAAQPLQQIGNCQVDFLHQKLHTPSGEHHLSYKETQLLKLLIEHRMDILERRNALLKIWGNDDYYNTRSMDVFISHLRKLLQEDTTLQILTIRGVGYKLLAT